MQRMHNLTKWFLLPEGHSIHFNNPNQRMVTVDVNCPGECNFYVVQDPAAVAADPGRLTDMAAGRKSDERPGVVLSDKSPSKSDRAVTFLARCVGRDRLEFGVEGPFELCCDGASPMVYTVDSTDTSTKIIAPLIFTKIANRRARNPQLELMQYQMRVNQERMYAALEEESTRRIAAMERRLESYAPERNKGTSLTPARQQPPVESGAGAGATGPAPKDEGEKPAGGAGGKKRKAAGAEDDSGTLI